MFRLLPYLICLLLVLGGVRVQPLVQVIASGHAKDEGVMPEDNSIVKADHLPTNVIQDNTINGDAVGMKSASPDLSSERAVLNQPEVDYRQCQKFYGIELTPAELTLLKTLKNRSSELDKQSQGLVLREKALLELESNVELKLKNLETIRQSIEEALHARNEHEEGKVQKLIKIYENMKPSDAAKILEELQMPILIRIVGGMKEQKSAPIIAAMNAKRAKEITTAIASKTDNLLKDMEQIA